MAFFFFFNQAAFSSGQVNQMSIMICIIIPTIYYVLLRLKTGILVPTSTIVGKKNICILSLDKKKGGMAQQKYYKNKRNSDISILSPFGKKSYKQTRINWVEKILEM